MDAIELATLDDAPPIDLDPARWPNNLNSLHTEQPELAEELRAAELPAHWRPVAALDGFPTYRVERAGQPPQWLAGTAAPLTRARAVLRYDQIGDKKRVRDFIERQLESSRPAARKKAKAFLDAHREAADG